MKNISTTKQKIDTIRGKPNKTHVDTPKKFWCNDISNLDGNTCCFNHWINLPRSFRGVPMPIFDYETDIEKKLEDNKLIWIAKATGLGITEFFLRWMSWKALTDESFKNSTMLIITGPNWDLSKRLIDRIKRLFNDRPGLLEKSDEYEVKFPHVTIEAKPSFHIDASRSYENVSVFIGDEANFFPQKDDMIVRDVAERYIGKSNPYIIWVSTTAYPKGFFYEIEKEGNSKYRRLWLAYTIGLDKIYDNELIEEAKKSPSFESEYNLKWGSGIGDIFNELNEDEYEIKTTTNDIIMTVDPAFGSSKFAIVISEKRNDCVYILKAQEFARPTPSDMIDLIKKYLKLYNIQNVLIDSAHPGLIKELSEYVGVQSINFREVGREMTLNAVKMIEDKQVRIHPSFIELIRQLRAAKFDPKGTVDKKIMTFDLYDCFIMALWRFQTLDYRSYHIPMDQQKRAGSHEQLIPICQACTDGNHESHSSEIWFEENVSHCKCSKCMGVKKKGLSVKTEVIE